jgi:hypothetical protein
MTISTLSSSVRPLVSERLITAVANLISSSIDSPVLSSVLHLGFMPQLHPSPTSYLNCRDHSSVATPPSSNTQPHSADCTLELFCWVQGDPHDQAFSLQIAETKTVSALKKAIKEEKKIAFGHVDADSLKLWKVSASYEHEPTPLRAVADNSAFGRSPST